jgi:hypothetical protein
MARTKNKIEWPSEGNILKRKVHPFQPWDVQHHPEHSEIEIYNEMTSKCEIAVSVSGLNHVAMAEFIAALANRHNNQD